MDPDDPEDTKDRSGDCDPRALLALDARHEDRDQKDRKDRTSVRLIEYETLLPGEEEIIERVPRPISIESVHEQKRDGRADDEVSREEP